MSPYLPALAAAAMMVPLAIFGLLFAKRYVRVKPDEALVVSGMRQRNGASQRIVLGGGTFVWPVFEEARRLSLSPIPVTASSGRALAEGHVRIRKETKAVGRAAERFLSLPPAEIGRIAAQVLEGLLLATPENLRERAETELNALGLEIVSLSLKDRA